MDDLNIEPLSERYIPEIELWLDNSELRNRFMEFYKSSQQWMDKNVTDLSHQAWVALLDSQAVAYFDATVDKEHHAHISFAVKPSERRRGIGKEIVQKALELPWLKQFSRITASIEPGNTAGQKILEASGFSVVGHDGDGLLELQKVR